MPTVSIVLTTFDRPHMLSRTVASVLAQSFEDFELIVVDDGSPTSYSEELECGADPRVRLVRLPRNAGVAAARNAGIQLARGRYVAFLDDDDEYCSTFLAETVSTLGKAPAGVGLSWCGVCYVDHPKEAGLPATRRTRAFPTRFPSRTRLLEALMSIGTGHGVCIDAQCLRRIGPFDPALRTAEDADLFLRLLSRGFLPTVVPGIHVVIHNHHGPRLTGAHLHPVRIAECELLVGRHAGFLESHRTIRDQLRRQIELLRSELASASLR